MIDMTLGTLATGIVGAVGLTALLNGLRHALVDESAFGTLLLFVAYGIYNMGPLL
jgi:hypothetical protein